jgi:fumarate hydratase subunit alpha
MGISYDLLKSVTSHLYNASLRKIPEETKQALALMGNRDRNETARKTINIMLESICARLAVAYSSKAT